MQDLPSIRTEVSSLPRRGLNLRNTLSTKKRGDVSIVARVQQEEIQKWNVGKGVVPKNETEMKSLLKSKEWVPLSLKTIKSAKESSELTHKEVVFVKVADLMNKLPLAAHKQRDLNQFLANQDPNQKITQIQSLLSLSLGIEATDVHMTKTLYTKLSRSVDPKAILEAQTFVETHGSIKIKESTLKKMEPERVGSSNTISDNQEKIKNWRKGDRFIREKIQTKEDLTLDDICALNKIIVGSKEENEALGTGMLRDAYVTMGGPGGPSFLPPHEVKTAMENLVVTINDGVKKCKKNKENPIVLASLAAQKFVSIHPFCDANGRTAGLIMDYILMKAELPPAARGTDIIPAIFGDQPSQLQPPNNTTTMAVELTLTAMEKSYALI